jgi:hypothetical protein
VFGAVLASAVPRTQGLLVDQHRRFLLDFARDFGEVKTARPEADIETTAPLANTVTELRRQSGLPAAEIARMAGIQRRQLYNLVDGGKTTPARERRIRSLASFVDQLHERFGDASVVRSVLLAPIGSDLRSFVDLATDGISIQDASRALETYLSRRQGRVRQYVQTPRRAREQERAAARLVDDTRDIFPDSE